MKELVIVMIGVIKEIKWELEYEYKWNVHTQKSGIIVVERNRHMRMRGKTWVKTRQQGAAKNAEP